MTIQSSFFSSRPPLVSTLLFRHAYGVLPVRNAQVPLIEVNTLKLGQLDHQWCGTHSCQRESRLLPRRRSAGWMGQAEKVEHVPTHHLSHVGSGEQVAHFFRPMQRVSHPLGMGVIRTEQDVLG